MLRPTFMGFETAKSGLNASQKGLDISGQNLTNWNAEGYTRQRITQVAVAVDSYRSRYTTNRAGLAGQGTSITGIGQTRDVFLDKRFREENSNVGYYDQANIILNDIQTALNEFDPDGDGGLREALLAIDDALQDFSLNAYSETHANIVLTEFKNLTQTIQQMSTKLQAARDQQIYDFEVSISEVNKKLQEIAGLNRAILESENAAGQNQYFGPNELYDQRNLLMDELSQYVDFTYESNADGTVNIIIGGVSAVKSMKYDQMEMQENPYTGVVSAVWISSNEAVQMKSGALRAYSDYLNGRGPNLNHDGETISKGFHYYKDKLNALAQSLVSTVNNIIPESDADGNPLKVNGQTVYKKLLGGMSDEPNDQGKYVVRDDIAITADNLSVSDEWSDYSGYVIYHRIDDGTTDNVGKYILALSDAIADGTQYFDSNGEEFRGTFLDYIKGYSTTLAEEVSFNDTRVDAGVTLLTSLEDSRDSVSGVVIDEEVANLMLYSKSYNAASRVMTAMDEALDVLINRTGRVGL